MSMNVPGGRAPFKSRQVALLLHLAKSVSQLATRVQWGNLSVEDSAAAYRAQDLLRGVADAIGCAGEDGTSYSDDKRSRNIDVV